MPPTSQVFDCQRFATAISAAGGTVPKSLRHLLSGYEVLVAPRGGQDASAPILDAIIEGTLDEKTLDRLLPAAATAASINNYRAELASRAERIVVSKFYRELENGGADEVLDSLRPVFDKHAKEIVKARGLFNSESTAEHAIASGNGELVEAWNGLHEHIQVVTKIAAVASQFGALPPAMFPQIKLFVSGDTFRLDDRALMCTSGPLVTDSALFSRPDAGHRSSPFFRAPLKLHSIAEAQARHDEWAAGEHDRLHAERPVGGWIDVESGVHHENPRPENPYRATTSVR